MQNEFQPYVWKKEFETGNEIIDQQHRELFRKIDNLLLAMYYGKEKSELSQLQKFMLDYIHNHFSTEENLMEISHYPDLEKHQAEHRQFIQLSDFFQGEIDKNGAGIYLANRMLKELRAWWENHILKSDMLIRDYIRKS